MSQISIRGNQSALSFETITKNIKTDRSETKAWLDPAKTPTHQQLFNAIATKYGTSVANSVFDQLSLSKKNNKPITAFNASKAISAAKDQKKTSYDSKIQYTSQNGDEESLQSTTKPFAALEIKNDVNGFIDQTDGGPVQVRTAALDTTDQEIANRQYKQILSALIKANPNLITKGGDGSANAPYQIEYAHMGLLSTADSKELKIAQEQMEFIQGLKDPINISSDAKRPLWVKPTVLYTNFSVEGPGMASTNSSPDEATEKTLDHYLEKQEDGKDARLLSLIPRTTLGSNNTWGGKTTVLDKDIKKLFDEVRDLRKKRTEPGSSFDSYQFQAKYSLLLEKCGIPTHVYCDSGNDRSLQFTKMSKMWHANPKLDFRFPDSARHIVKSFSLQGNETLARLSKGFSGNKANAGYLRLINSLTPLWNLRAKISNQYSSLFYNRGWTKAYTPPPPKADMRNQPETQWMDK